MFKLLLASMVAVMGFSFSALAEGDDSPYINPYDVVNTQAGSTKELKDLFKAFKKWLKKQEEMCAKDPSLCQPPVYPADEPGSSGN